MSEAETVSDEREFDVVVLGATGAAGKWVVRYLGEREWLCMFFVLLL